MDMKETDDLTECELLDVKGSPGEVSEGGSEPLRDITYVFYTGYSSGIQQFVV